MKFFLKTVFILSILFLSGLGSFAYAQSTTISPTADSTSIPNPQEALKGVKNNVDTYKNNAEELESKPEIYVARVVQTVLVYLGSIFLLLMLYAGTNWMLANGNSDRIDRSKSILVNSSIAFFIIAFAYSIATYIVSTSETVKMNTSSNQNPTPNL